MCFQVSSCAVLLHIVSWESVLKMNCTYILHSFKMPNEGIVLQDSEKHCRQYLSSWTSAMTLYVGCNTCRCRRWGRKRPSFLGFAALQCVLESARTLSPWRRAALRPDCQSSFCNSCGQGSRHHPIPKMGLVLPGRGLYGQNANTRSLLHKRLTESECIQEHDRQVLGESGLDSSSPWSLVLETQLNARSMVIYTWCAAVCLKKIPGMQVCEACSSVRNASNNDCTRHNSFQRAAMEFYKTQTFSLAVM